MRKRLIAIALMCSLGFGAGMQVPAVKADSATVVSVGADLTEAQKDKMFDYFGVNETEVAVIEVNNDEERQYLEGVATEKQIGYRTYSCAYIEETKEGNGINVKVANLNWVTSHMIKSTLATAGIYDCNVVAAAPFEVSGTGALTGIMKAFEIVTGTELEEEKKEIATEEIVITGNLAEQIGNDEAIAIITEVKDTIIAENVINADEIGQVIIDSSKHYNVTLTDEQVEMITNTMVKIAEQDYDYERLENTFHSIMENAADKLGVALENAKDSGFFDKIVNFFRSIVEWFKNLFVSNDKESTGNVDLGILENTNDDLLGDAIIESTEDAVEPTQSATTEPTKEPEVTEAPVSTEVPDTTVEPVEESTEQPEAVETTSPTELPEETVAPTEAAIH